MWPLIWQGSFEKGGHTVLYSGLRQIPAIIQHALKSDATIVFARANQQVYWLVRMVTLLCKNVWIVCVQKPEAAFRQLNDQHPLKCSYLTIIESDVADIKLSEGKVKQKIGVGINAEKFAPVSAEQARRLKQKYGFDPEKTACYPRRALFQRQRPGRSDSFAGCAAHGGGQRYV